jgi:2-polyprenyl-3-methyl-5-hydroxy-6-metoxy-1,4-benzoquinol methylase
LSGLSEKQVTPLSEDVCPVCNSKELRVFFEISDVPVSCNTLWRSRDAARNCPKEAIKLAFCPVCSLIMNIDFEPSLLEYTQAYKNPLHFSPYFQDYAQSLAERLVEHYNLHNKDIIEIGCGDGYFLRLLCQLGNNRGVGFDPAYVEKTKHNALKNQVKFIQDYYSERYRDYQGDLIVCRQVLEHIYNPKGFLKMLRRTIGNRVETHVFFEVPKATQIFRRLFIWDMIYEHYSYFTSHSLAHAFATSGFSVSKLTEEFEGQYLCLHAQPSDQAAPYSDYRYPGEVSRIASDTASFAASYQKKVETWRHKLEQMEDRGQVTVVWGAGSKGVSFLNALKDLKIEYVVDINPQKQGMYIPGTGHQIVGPQFLREYQPDIIVVMNPIYRREIQQLTKKLGLTTKLIPA